MTRRWIAGSQESRFTARCARALCCAAFAFVAPIRAENVFQYPLSADQVMRDVLSEPARVIKDSQVVRGEFVYLKHLAELPNPLESKGEFLFIKDVGIVWHTQMPFDSEFVITAQGIRQREGGKTAQFASGNEQAAVRAAARIFLSLLSLDIAALKSTFELYGSKQGDRWLLGLKPVAPTVAAIFRDAVVGGSAQVETVRLQDANGDRTEILFKNTVASRSPASPQDQQRFGP